jgi:hypothetical protein
MHEMTKSEILGRLTGEALDFCKNYLFPYLLAQQQLALQQATVHDKVMKRGVIDYLDQRLMALLMGLMNQQKVSCAKCHKFTEWTIGESSMVNALSQNGALSKEESL